jgi:chaperonin cofactor prefoldin
MAAREPSTADLDQASDQFKELLSKRPELGERVRILRRQLIEMKVALSELEEIREEHERGRLTEDMYLTRRMKLKTDYLLASESISELEINSLLDEVKDPIEKSRLQKLKDKIISNKDKILFLVEIGASLLRAAIGQK